MTIYSIFFKKNNATYCLGDPNIGILPQAASVTGEGQKVQHPGDEDGHWTIATMIITKLPSGKLA